MDMILGVLVILGYFLVVLVTMLETARRDGQSNTEADTVSTSWSLTETNGVEGMTTLDKIISDFPNVTSPGQSRRMRSLRKKRMLLCRVRFLDQCTI